MSALFTIPPTVKEPAGLAGPIPQPSLLDPVDDIDWNPQPEQEG